MQLNPLGLNTTGGWPGNTQQTGTPTTSGQTGTAAGNPAAIAAVASYAVGANMLNISQPLAKYTQVVSGSKDAPNGWATPSGT
jgi:hypothetical protein